MPYRRVYIVTPLSPEEVRERLQKITRGRLGIWEVITRSFRARPADPVFIGVCQDASFKIQRDIRYGNSFLPVIRGRIVSRSPGETMVTVRMTVPLLTAIFMAFWFSGVVLAVGFTVPQLFRKGDLLALTPLGLLAAGVAMVWIGFYPETRKAERAIRNALGGTRGGP